MTRKVFVLHGLGGMGKTQLAVDFARRHVDTFSASLWFDGGSEDRLRQGIVRCVSRIPGCRIPVARGVEDEYLSEVDINAAVEKMMEWLARPNNTDWLLIFDDVGQGQEEGGAYDVGKYFPGNHGSILITSRLPSLNKLGNSQQLGRVSSDLAGAFFEGWHGGYFSEHLFRPNPLSVVPETYTFHSQVVTLSLSC